MRKTLISSLLLTFALTSCADHAGTGIVADNGPQAPINQPDTRVIEPSGGTSGSNLEPGNGGVGSGSTPGGGSGPGGTGGAGSGGEPGGGNNPPQGGGGGQGGSPVPEPGTLLLVGTGLAGLAGAAMRRRQKKANLS